MTGIHGPSPSRHPVISGCLSRWPYNSTVRSASAGSVAGISQTISGVSPSIRWTSIVMPSTGRFDNQPCTSSTARSMWPFASQSAS